MPCFHPMKGFYYGKTDSGKDNLIITSYDIDHIEVDGKGNIIRCFDHDSDRANHVIRKFTEIPCGKCSGCQLDRSRSFSDRIFLEMKEHEENCFLTLTYSDDKLPLNPRPKVVDPETGEVKQFELVASCRKSHISQFIKALRNKVNFKGYDENGKALYFKKEDPEFTKIRFFACTEYGSRTRRPHLHLIIFGWSPLNHDPDLLFVGKNDLGMDYFASPLIEKVWKYGNNIVSEASYETGAYVARYCQKKAFGQDKAFFESNFIEPESINMSRNPGIGKAWFDSHKDCYAGFSFIDFKTEKGNQRVFPNRYFDRLMEQEDDDPDNLQEVTYRESMFKRKEERRYFKEQQKKIKYASSSKSYQDALLDEEAAFNERTKVLRLRKEI